MTKKKDPKDLKKVGRQTKYTPEMVKLICQRVATHDCGLNRLCEMYDDMPTKVNINIWRRTYPEFRTLYAQAKCEQIEFLTEDILDIADDGTNDWMEHYDKNNDCISWRVNGEHIQRSRVRIDTRKWLASKLAPKIYGDLAKEEIKDDMLEDSLKRKNDLDEKNKKEF